MTTLEMIKTEAKGLTSENAVRSRIHTRAKGQRRYCFDFKNLI